jgi:IS5 family transposase
MVGLMLLQHMHGLSDEQVAHQWVQNPYWHYFCGYDYLQWNLPSDPSSLTRWRSRLGEGSIEKVLGQTIVTAIKAETVAPQDLKRVISDTTVMEKNISFPTDTKLLNKAREKLVRGLDSVSFCGPAFVNDPPLSMSTIRLILNVN